MENEEDVVVVVVGTYQEKIRLEKVWCKKGNHVTYLLPRYLYLGHVTNQILIEFV